MVCKSIHALADGLSLHDASSFSTSDWTLIETAVSLAKKAKIETPVDIIPMVTLIGTIWDGWDRMRRADRDLALPLVASITPDLQAALGGIRASLESRIDQVPDWIANTDTMATMTCQSKGSEKKER